VWKFEASLFLAVQASVVSLTFVVFLTYLADCYFVDVEFRYGQVLLPLLTFVAFPTFLINFGDAKSLKWELEIRYERIPGLERKMILGLQSYEHHFVC
jgi:hypothetical protein